MTSEHPHSLYRQPAFQLGRILITPNAMEAIPAEELRTALARHSAGDWGDIDEHDQRENQFALAQGLRLMSVYRGGQSKPFWIITEADRSATTILLPEDY